MQTERRQSEIMQSERRQSEIMQSKCRQSENRRSENVQSANLSLPRDSSALATLRRLYVLRDAWIPVLKKKKKGDHTIAQLSRRTEILTLERSPETSRDVRAVTSTMVTVCQMGSGHFAVTACLLLWVSLATTVEGTCVIRCLC